MGWGVQKNVKIQNFVLANLFILMSSNSECALSFLIFGFLSPKIGFFRSGWGGGGVKKNFKNQIFDSANLFILMSSNSECDLIFLIFGFLSPKIGFFKVRGGG